ncbi:hypothetical protein SY83_13630 [Paenibacillus swuensis]|uniref:GerMN domain-containing protein n=1 Tax=Paenibacillus swuensis TaxID=1178515 RepID=A0A172TJ88_9BACL|nr:GerMN domain-containing protein [Paenibacillus swuensis]ANE47129.1 hypothetical protein SY83_13630 [Paenibacillus swuensis]
MTFSAKMRGAAIVGLVALPLLTTGCGLLKSGTTTGQIDPPQGEILTGQDTAVGAVETTDANEMSKGITLYLKDANNYVAPVTLNVPKVDGIAKMTLAYLVEDGEYKDLLPEGFTAILPKGTQVKELNIDPKSKLATVDFSKEFVNYNAQDERKILEAVTYTLTGFPTIQSVQIRVEGKALTEMPEAATPLDEPLTRGMGINIEKSADLDASELGNSSPVTLYFLGKTEAEETYFVPVTRLVRRTDNMAQAAVQQLIKGPLSSSQLTSVMDPGAQVLQVAQQEGIITVNLSGEIQTPELKVPSETLQSVILSLTENTGASKVQILIDGDKEVSGTDEQSYSKPVTRPAHVNPVEL